MKCRQSLGGFRSRTPGLMSRRRALVGLFVLVVLAPAALTAAAELLAEKKGAIDARIAELMQKQQVPGLSAAIVVDGQLAYERGYGLADVENNVQATGETIYRLASISKMLTATAAMQLVEQGKLDLSAPIQKYVPEFPEKQAPITAELLLKHQSGIRHYKGDEVRSAVFYNRVGDALVLFKDEPLLFAPGERMSYTTYGYNLLGAAIEGASGEEYVGYVHQHVCQPAGMKTIQPDNPYKIIPSRAAGYRLHGFGEKAELRNDYMVDVTNKIPGGGWCSTPGDLARFAIALCEGRLVRRETLEKMWTPQKTAKGVQTDCGLGCFTADVQGQRRIYHSGGQPKVSTFLIIAPDQKAAVALMCNRSGTGLKPLANALLDQVAQPVAAAK
jgi:CubicO group peptidase (beta-lactamase class C family)